MNIQARTRADIKRVGWSVIGVFASANSPTFAYTIGATETLEAPELLLFGLRRGRAVGHRIRFLVQGPVQKGRAASPFPPAVPSLTPVSESVPFRPDRRYPDRPTGVRARA